MLQAVPHAGIGLGLLHIQLSHVLYIELEKVNQLASGINFSLKGIFGLAEHGGCIYFGAVGTSEQFSRSQKDRGAVFPTGVFPSFFRCQGRLNRRLYMTAVSLVEMPQNMLVLMRWTNGYFVVRMNGLANDYNRNINSLRFVRCQLCL